MDLVPVICEQCAGTFKVTMCRMSRFRVRFCSQSCREAEHASWLSKPLTREILEEWLDYDSQTGIFTWKGKDGRSYLGRAPGKEAGHFTKQGYRQIRYHGDLIFAHHLAWLWVYGELPTCIMDHVNCVRDDNRISNLRLATSAENARNTQIGMNNKSGYKGVSWSESKGKWRATITVDGRQKYLGNYDDPKEAYAAYCSAAPRLHGEFARIQ
jgi:hypothetical protein